MANSPWPNEYQVNVAVVPPKYESEALANWRLPNAGGVPYLSLTEIPDGLSGIIVKGAIDSAQNCDHQCRMVRKFPTGDGQWDYVLGATTSRWPKWLASEPRSIKKGQLILAAKPESINATSPSELMEELTP